MNKVTVSVAPVIKAGEFLLLKGFGLYARTYSKLIGSADLNTYIPGLEIVSVSEVVCKTSKKWYREDILTWVYPIKASIWFNSDHKSAHRDHWVMDVYGAANLAPMAELAKELSDKFDVRIDVILSNNSIQTRTFTSN